MLGIDKICIHISCEYYHLSLIKELNLLRVLQFISGCGGVNTNSADAETVSFTAPYTALPFQGPGTSTLPTPRGRGHILQDRLQRHLQQQVPPAPVLPSRRSGYASFLETNFYFMEA